MRKDDSAGGSGNGMRRDDSADGSRRRRFLKGIGAIGTAGLAGCLGGDGSADTPTTGGPTESPTDTPSDSPTASPTEAPPETAPIDEERLPFWSGETLQFDTEAHVRRSDIVLEAPPAEAEQSMAIGNGRLGAAVWAQGGFTAQLNPNHTVGVQWKSAGTLVVPGLADLVDAGDYAGRVNLHEGVFRQSGGGTTAEAYVHAAENLAVLAVEGADPQIEQHARLELPAGREPDATISDPAAAFAETWEGGALPSESSSLGETRTFAAIAAIAADGREQSVTVADDRTIEVSFFPHEDGQFRVVVSVPPYPGDDVAGGVENALDAVTAAVEADEEAWATRRSDHTSWWRAFWEGANLMTMASGDGAAGFYENLRVLDLYYQASMNRGRFPGHHAGEAHLFRFNGDAVDWIEAGNGYWHWNARYQPLAALPAGLVELTEPFFRMYRETLDLRRTHTSQEMAEARDRSEGVGAAIPETMGHDGTASMWDLTDEPSWKTRVNSTGGEVAHEAWLRYRYTDEESVLEEYYPLMAETTRFMLAYAEENDEGDLYTEPSYAHETQRDTRTPSTDVAVMEKMFPLVADLAERVGDDGLAADLEVAIPKLPDYPRDENGSIALSALDVETVNVHNTDTEPIWPWGLFGDAGGDRTDLAELTLETRQFELDHAWAPGPIQAARLGLAEEVASMLSTQTGAFVTLPSGMAVQFGDDPYVEYLGVLTNAIQEAAIQSYDGLIRIAPAWPGGWDADVQLDVVGNHRVSTQIRDGTVQYVGVEAGSEDTLRIRNPWSVNPMRVVDGGARPGETPDGADPIRGPTTDDEISFPVAAGETFVLERVGAPLTRSAFESIARPAGDSPRVLGDARIGIPGPAE